MALSVRRDGETISIELTAMDAALAFKASLDIPWDRITRITAMDRVAVPYTGSTWLRAPGGYLPGVFRHGSYGWKPNREFWAVWQRPRVLVIDVENWDYHRVVLGVEHADGIANDLNG